VTERATKRELRAAPGTAATIASCGLPNFTNFNGAAKFAAANSCTARSQFVYKNLKNKNLIFFKKYDIIYIEK
jgi:hypothetical protein